MCALASGRITLFIVGLLVSVPLLSDPAAAGEDPQNQDCVGALVVRLLCAGADAGGNAECDNEANDRPEVRCTYTFGWNLNASAQLPGGGRLNWSYEVTACLDGADCTVIDTGSDEKTCLWAVNTATPCAETDLGEGAHDVVLELGQCVTVTARVSVWAEAWAPDEQMPALYAFVDDDGEGGAASCYLDDGRD